MPLKPIIQLEEVSTVYEGERRPAVSDINLRLDQNELVYVIGPNAAGKTTLLETINGLLPTFKGEVFVFGLNVRARGKDVRREIGYVPQDFMVEPGEPYMALDVVLMGRYGKMGVLHKPEKRDLEKTMEAMRLMDVDDLADRPMGKLSGGQQQKVMIARALAKAPEILLLDEPFSNLDPDSRVNIPELIGRIHRERQMTTIIVTHDVGQMMKQCRRVVVMNNGRIVADEPPEKALAVLESPFVSRPAEVAP
jgi:zinc/manganese transport system ATP-binding protein